MLEFWKKVFGKRLIAKIRPVNTFLGNSYNVLSAYTAAYKTDAKYVYIIEDDILVAKDFFKWHAYVQEPVRTNPFYCSIAGACNLVPPPPDRLSSYFTSNVYRSLGVCWKRENLEEVVKHDGPLYYASEHGMVDYLFNMFPDTKYKYNEMIEQDGLICRIMERHDKLAAWSTQNRAFHIGLWGYHRSIGQKAMIEAGFRVDVHVKERIETLRNLLKNADWVKSVADFQTDIQLPQ